MEIHGKKGRGKEGVSLLICEKNHCAPTWNVIHIDFIYMHRRKIFNPYYVESLMKTLCRRKRVNQL